MLRELTELREEAASFARRWSVLRYRRAAGLPPSETLGALLRDHPLATSGDGLAQAKETLANAEGEDPRRPARLSRLGSLRDLLVRARAMSLEPSAAQELFELDHRACVRPPGDAGLHGALPPVAVERELPFLKARDKRAQLEQALSDASEELDSARTAAWEAAQAALAEAGTPDGTGLHARGWTGAPAREAAERVLTATDAVAKDLGGWLLERHAEIDAREAERHDVLHLIHAPHCASAFPGGELLRTVRRWAEQLRLDLGASSAVKLDEDDRPLKALGAFTAPIDPPFEVRITALIHEGPRALAAVLGAVSVAQLRAGPPGDAPPEDLWLSDPAVDEACHALLAGLVRDEGFLVRCAKVDLKRDDVRALSMAYVYEARLAAARTLASLETHESGPTARAAHACRELYHRATGAALPRGLALTEPDPFLSAFGTLRGLALAARMRASLIERFDVDYWRNPRALPSLQSLWLRGGRPTAAELWAELGGEMSVEPLCAELIAACS